MPIYNYECACGKEFTEWNSIEDRSTAKCPACNAKAKQVLSIPAVHDFKLGWFEHITDQPVRVGSKKELKEMCDRHGVYAPGVLD